MKNAFENAVCEMASIKKTRVFYLWIEDKYRSVNGQNLHHVFVYRTSFVQINQIFFFSFICLFSFSRVIQSKIHPAVEYPLFI